jgi:hypothetical protein
MKLKFKVTGLTTTPNKRIFVQLQGEYGHVSLNVPEDQAPAFQIGREAIFEIKHGTFGSFIGEIDETKPIDEPKLIPNNVLSGVEDVLSGRTLLIPSLTGPKR